MSFYFIILLEKEGEIEEKLAKQSIGEDVQEKKFGGKFQAK